MRTRMALCQPRPAGRQIRAEPTHESTRVPLRAAPALSHAHPVDRARGHHRGRARPRLPRSRDGRGAPGRRQAAAARALAVQASVGGREPPVLQLVRPAGAEGPERLPDVRPTHRAARLLRPPMTVPRALLLSLVAVAGIAAGCGGGSVDYKTPEAKYVPPLTAPPQGGASSANATTSTTATTTTATTAAPATGGTGGTSAGTATPTPAPSGAGTGGAGTTTAPSGATTTPQNTGGADFNTFCQENPGAC